MFTSVTAFSTGHLSYINAPYVILPPNARSIENYGMARSRVTYLVITYTAGTFAFNGSWNNSSTISYIYVPDTKVSAYSGRTVYPIIGQESIIEKDREFTLTIPEARYGWHNDLHWTVEDNDYISIVSQGDGVATFRATGILPDTDTTVTLSYQSNRGNGYFKGTKVLTVKPTPVIEFEDAEAKRICVANWGGGQSVITKVQGVMGELTYEQAAAVTSIGTQFSRNTLVTAFSEIQYFTSVKSLASQSFYNCSNLRGTMKLSDSITTINSYSFSGCGVDTIIWSKNSPVGTGTSNTDPIMSSCPNLSTLITPHLKIWRQNRTCQYSYKLKYLYLPDTLQSMYLHQSFSGTTIYIYAETPPSLTFGNNNTGTGTSGITKIYVPQDVYNDYLAATNWNRITSILAPFDTEEIPYPYSEYD